MSISRKYGKTYHYPFSPGTTSDDRINQDYWNDMILIDKVIHTEKLDGENIYAIHSIEYPTIEAHFYVFGIREKEQWLSWEETVFYAKMLDFKTVPVIGISQPKLSTQQLFEQEILVLFLRKSSQPFT